MLKSHEKFHSANGKRLILIVDDEAINRELMGLILEKDYELLYAADGQEALDKIRRNRELLSLVLLDLMMPVMPGKEVLRAIKADPALRHIPVIVLTADQNAEVESLQLGATDFIPKPYPKASVIEARVLRTIELSEDRQIIQSTERDALTGLYNREFFYRYAEQFDQHHKDLSMDAMVVDVNHFHMVNERFGTAYGDEILRRIGEKLREMVQDTGGIVCRREADTFMVYCPHGKDYRAILDSAAAALADDESISSRVRLRMGVYAETDKTLDIERRFDRAKQAADTVRNSFTNPIGIYDSILHERELYAEQLIEDFHRAIDEGQFLVYFQPKFDVRPEIPVLASAEALVRWRHPELGMISPGIFIPLFEENGLIQTLDEYVWRTTAAQISDWKERLGFTVPVSVNVSRIDMYDPNLIGVFRGLLRDYDLSPSELQLEITESAYTQDSEQIISAVESLRALGFKIEMDDFGTGYSSLNMISTLPIDALKLDMQFIRNAFKERRDTRMLEVIIDIADYLSVPVIAEGVETEEQLNALKAMGCDLVQGYYFSRPVPPEEYEPFVVERRALRIIPAPGKMQRPARSSETHGSGFGKIALALSSGFESVYYVDTANNHYVEFSSEGKYEDLQIERSGADFFTDTQRNIPRVVYEADRERLSLCMRKEALLAQLMDGRPFSMTYRLLIEGRPVFYNIKVVRAGTHDDHHIVIGVSNVDEQVRQTDEHSRQEREQDLSSLASVTTYSRIAQALAQDYFSIYYVDTDTDRFVEYSAYDEYSELGIEKSGEDFFNLSRRNMRRVGYPEDLPRFLAAFTKENVMRELEKNGSFTINYRLIFNGEPNYVSMKATRMGDANDHHIVIGVNNVDAQMRREAELMQAQERANRDPLTGVKSKHAYAEEELRVNAEIQSGQAPSFSVAFCDVNGLKTANDTMGHAAGDGLLRAAAMIICNIFDHSPVYRYGGDEFVVLLRGRDYQGRGELLEQLERENRERGSSGGVIVACGLADYVPGRDTSLAQVLERADAAMYKNKSTLKGEC